MEIFAALHSLIFFCPGEAPQRDPMGLERPEAGQKYSVLTEEEETDERESGLMSN